MEIALYDGVMWEKGRHQTSSPERASIDAMARLNIRGGYIGLNAVVCKGFPTMRTITSTVRAGVNVSTIPAPKMGRFPVAFGRECVHRGVH
jgi:hypothetical protein